MFFPEERLRVHVYGKPVDMRKSYDGLCALTRHTIGQDPLSGSLFVFINRRGTQVKILYWDRSGFCIWGKRLERGRFVSDWSKMRSADVEWMQLKMMLDGIVESRRRQRYSVPINARKAA